MSDDDNKITIRLTKRQAATVRYFLNRLHEWGRKSPNLFTMLGIGAREIEVLDSALMHFPEIGQKQES